MKNIAIIPARMGSTRYPGKPMKKICGMPMIGHVYYRARMISNIDLVCVATCNKVIFDYITSIGGLAVMTSNDHERASDRASEALLLIEKKENTLFDMVAMIQGDEPLLNPNDIKLGLMELTNTKDINIVNLMGEFKLGDDSYDKNIVKVVINLYNNALYFSRESIPSKWQTNKIFPIYYQTGLIIFKRNYLLQFNALEQTPLEIIESVDMMRVIENGGKIKMIKISGINIGVDTESDMEAVRSLMSSDSFFKQYNTL